MVTCNFNLLKNNFVKNYCWVEVLQVFLQRQTGHAFSGSLVVLWRLTKYLTENNSYMKHPSGFMKHEETQRGFENEYCKAATVFDTSNICTTEIYLHKQQHGKTVVNFTQIQYKSFLCKDPTSKHFTFPKLSKLFLLAF